PSPQLPAVYPFPLHDALPISGFLFGDLTIADIAIACLLRNAAFARFAIDATRWPRAAGLVERTLATASFQRLRPFEDESGGARRSEEHTSELQSLTNLLCRTL